MIFSITWKMGKDDMRDNYMSADAASVCINANYSYRHRAAETLLLALIEDGS